MKKRALIAIITAGLMLPTFTAWAEGPITEQKARESYAIGYQFGTSLKQQAVDVDQNALMMAIKDGVEGKTPALTSEEMGATMETLRQRMLTQQETRNHELAAKNAAEGAAFLQENARKQGVKTLPSGIQYKVLADGTGPKPVSTDTVTVNYIGKLIDGTEFDSSYKRNTPVSFNLSSVIIGWREVLPMMKTGSKWEVAIPSELGYGERQAGPIAPGSTLVFEIELLSIGAKDAAPAKPAAKPADKPKK